MIPIVQDVMMQIKIDLSEPVNWKLPDLDLEEKKGYRENSIIIESDKKNVFWQKKQYLGEDGWNEKYGARIVLKNGEPNLGERMIKALNHLSSFCGKGEAF